MRENRESIMKINMEITDDSTQSALRTIKRRVYQEDRASFNHLKTKDPRNFNITEIQLLMAIAYDGLELRQRLDRKLVASILELTGIGSKKSQRALFLKWLNNELKVIRGDYPE